MSRYFRKPKAKAILEVEYSVEGSVIRVLSQIKVEQAIIEENSKRFKLVYNSPILRRDILETIGIKGKKEASNLLVHHKIMVPGVSLNIASFLRLLY